MSAKIKIAECFYSLQGEGLYLGTPSVFLRVFGCNFTCSGFGMPRGELSQERLNVDPRKMMLKPIMEAGMLSIAPVGPSTELTLQYQKYEELPLVHTGCDSYASWDPRFKHLSPVMTIEEIVDKMQTILPDGKFNGRVHLILTGGEPLLGWQKAYIELLQEIEKRQMFLTHITFETNGTQKLDLKLSDYLVEFGYDVTFSISSKLPSSGHNMDEAILPLVVDTYRRSNWMLYFKWVLTSEEDLVDIKAAIEKYDTVMCLDDIPIYLMPCGGTNQLYNVNEKWVAEMAMKLGLRYSPRLQVQLWKNAWGT